MDNSFIIWFSAIFFFLFLEIGHPGLLYFTSFSFGALCAFIAAFFNLSITFQCILFTLGTVSALLLVHFFTLSQTNHLPTTSHRSNLDAFIGKKVIVFRSLQNPEIWQAKIFGQSWVVKSIDEQILYDGQQVVIIDIQGCHLRVNGIK